MLVSIKMKYRALKWNVARKCRRCVQVAHFMRYNNFGLGGNWAGITQNVIRYSVVNRRLIVTCLCLLYIYTRYVVFAMILLRINSFSIVSYSSRKFLSCIYSPSNVYHFRYIWIEVWILDSLIRNFVTSRNSKCLFLFPSLWLSWYFTKYIFSN